MHGFYFRVFFYALRKAMRSYIRMQTFQPTFQMVNFLCLMGEVEAASEYEECASLAASQCLI